MLDTMTVEELHDDLDGDLFDAGGARLSDRHAEEALLGYLLHKPGAITETLDILQPRDLHDPFHRRIYELLLKCYERDDPPTMETWKVGLGDVAGPLIARLLANADLGINAEEIADHLFNVAERRAVGSADDIDFSRGAPFVSKFGAQRWEDIGLGGASIGYPWLVEDVIPLGEIAMAFGDTGTGKSFSIFDMAMCIARRKPFNNHNVEPGLVVYVAAEAGKGFAKRKLAYAIQHNLEQTDPLPFVLLTKRPNFFQDDVDVIALIDEIKSICRMYNVPLVLIVLDTVSAITQGMDEISGKDQALVRKRLLLLQEAFSATVLVVHHKPKSGNGPRGHGSQTADIENTIEFETVNDKKTDTGKTIHRATVRKQREGKSGMFWEFTLPVVEVGRNKWGNAETSCVVQVYDAGGPRAPNVGFRATDNEKLFLRALFEAMVDNPSMPPVGLPASITRVVEQRYVRVLMKSRMIDGDEDQEKANTRFKTAFSRAGAKLRDSGIIGIQGALLWPTGKPVNGFTA